MESQIKNKRLKMSPNGLITLPVSARKALGMAVNEPTKVSLKVADKKLVLSGNYSEKDKTWRVSKNGIMELKAEAKQLLGAAKGRYYWLDINDKKREATLVPY